MGVLIRSKYGELLASPATEAQWVADPSAAQVVPPIEIDRFCRNGQHPNPVLQNQVNAQANAAVLYRSKEVFSAGDEAFGANIASGGAGDRQRWRFAFRTGPYTHALYYVVIMGQPSAGFTNNTYSRLDLFTVTDESAVVVATNFVYGNDPTNGTDSGFGFLKVITGFVDGITGDTAYYGRFVDVDNGCMVAACVFDLQSMTENTGGYLAQSATTHTPVLNLHRSLPVNISNALWQIGGAHVLNWSVNAGASPITTTSATLTNIVDGTSTGAPTAATPGYTLNMTDKDRLNSGGNVACVMKAFAKVSGAVTGTVYLKDSSNNTVTSVAVTSTTAGWVSATFNLPATVAKYDLQFATSAGTLSLYAVSIYEYG
jgi:hypothetical protein